MARMTEVFPSTADAGTGLTAVALPPPWSVGRLGGGPGQWNHLGAELFELLGGFLLGDQVDGVEPLSQGEFGDDLRPDVRGGADRLRAGSRAGTARRPGHIGDRTDEL